MDALYKQNISVTAKLIMNYLSGKEHSSLHFVRSYLKNNSIGFYEILLKKVIFVLFDYLIYTQSSPLQITKTEFCKFFIV